MIRFARLFLWLRWKLLRGYLKEVQSKGALSSASAALSALLFVLAGIVLVLVAGALAFGAAEVASGLTDTGEESTVAAAILRIALAAMFVVLLLLPAVRAGRGSFGRGSSGIGRLLLLPISRAHLHSLEVLGSLSDPLLLAGLPALAVLGVTVALHTSLLASAVVLITVTVMFFALMTWSALIGIAMQLLFRDRRRAELALLLTFTVTIGLSLFPALLSVDQADQTAKTSATVIGDADVIQQDDDSESTLESVATDLPDNHDSEVEQRWVTADIVRLLDTFPVYLQWIPSESFSRTIKLAAQGRGLGALPSLLSLAAFAAACWLLSLRLWDRLLRSPVGGQRRVPLTETRLRSWDLPLISKHASTVAYATARGFLRTVRGKLALVTVPMMTLLLGLMFRSGQILTDIGGALGNLLGGSGFLVSFALLMSLLNALPLLANVFATDGAGFTLQALSPIPTRQLIWGKVAGTFTIYLVCLLPSLALATLLTRSGLSTLLDAFIRGFGAFAVAIAVGVWSSLLFPKAVELSSLNNKGNPHPLAQVASMLAVGLAMLLGSLGGLLGTLFLGGGAGRLIGTSLAAIVLCLIAWPTLEAAARGLEERWESVVVAASG